MSHDRTSGNDWANIEKAMSALPDEIEPANDGWSAVKDKILNQSGRHTASIDSGMNQRVNQPVANRGWMPYAVAASLLVAVASSILSIKTLSDYQAFQQSHDHYVAQQQEFQLLEQRRQIIKASFVEDFSNMASKMDPEVAADIQNNLVIIEQALLDIRKAMIAEPDNARLTELLEETYQREEQLIERVEQSFSSMRGEA